MKKTRNSTVKTSFLARNLSLRNQNRGRVSPANLYQADLYQAEAKLFHIESKILEENYSPAPKKKKLHLSSKDSNERNAMLYCLRILLPECVSELAHKMITPHTPVKCIEV